MARLAILLWAIITSVSASCPKHINLTHGRVEKHRNGLRFHCHQGYVLQPRKKFVHCTDFNAKSVPECVERPQRDEPNYGDYYDYNYEDESGYVDEVYEDYPEESYNDVSDDEDYVYDDYEGSGREDYQEPIDRTTISITTERPPVPTTEIRTTTLTSTAATMTTTYHSTTMPTDDEDLYQGSGSGDNEEIEEGSGAINALTPQEIDSIRRSFYYETEVDLLRVDTSCQDNFISAPQIFHAKTR